jgi:ATP-dependent Clp protease ATP-binding subunit ClpC
MTMFEGFTDQSRRTVVLAVDECRRLGHAQIDPAHLLLGLLMQDDAMASRLLTNFGVDVGAMRRDVEHAMRLGSLPPQHAGHIPFNPQTKQVIDLALREASKLRHRHIGTQHLLLALIGADGSTAATALQAAGVDLERTKQRIAVLTPPGDYEETKPPHGDPVEDDPSLNAIRAAKDAALDRGDLEAAASFRAAEREMLHRLREGGPTRKPN